MKGSPVRVGGSASGPRLAAARASFTSGRRDRHHGDRAAGLLLVGGVAVLVVLVDDPPEALVVRVRRLRDSRPPWLPLAPDLDLDVRVGAEVVQPGRMLRRAAVGGDDQVVV